MNSSMSIWYTVKPIMRKVKKDGTRKLASPKPAYIVTTEINDNNPYENLKKKIIVPTTGK